MRGLLIIAAACLVGGCANKTMYEWGSYQSALVDYTKNQDKQKFEAELLKSIEKAEAVDNVPPGLYAELGYLLYEQRRYPEASQFFVKEKQTYPESASLMDKLIAGAENTDGGESQ